MIRIYCPICNGMLKLQEDQKEAVCLNCGHVVQVPQGYTEVESSYLFAAEAVKRRDFQGAVQAYTDLLRAYPGQAEAYFRRALAAYEIEYQKLSDGSYRLVCHQAEKTDFLENEDVKKALSLADGTQKETYLEQAKKIQLLQNQVSDYAKSHLPVDVWLSVAGENILSVDQAVKIRQLLKAVDLNVFCPELDLIEEDRRNWECALYRAESTAKVMILTAAEKDGFTEDVNFDAERFLYRKEKAPRAAKNQIPSLIVAFSNLDEYEDIPDSYFDGIDHRLDMLQDNFASELREAVEKAMRDYRGALKEQAGTHDSFSYANLLLQARQTLEGGRFEEAAEQYRELLLKNPTESQAYWGLLLCARGCRTEQELIQTGNDLTKEGNYQNALAFASEREQQTYREVADKVQEMASVYEEQEKERKRIEREQEEERRRQEIEVEKAGKRKQEEERRAKQRRSARIRLFLIVVLVAAAVSGIGYVVYSKSPQGIMAKQYKEAKSAYSRNQYEEAYDLFADLEDYKDSAQFAEMCWGKLRQSRYKEVVGDIDDMKRRADAITVIRTAEPYVAEASGVLEEMYAEGLAYLEEGKIYEAWNTLRSFEESDENRIRAWRRAFGYGCLSGSSDGKILVVTENGELFLDGIGGSFEFEEGTVRSASLSDSGASAGVVRSDGTAYLRGAVSENSVSGWKDLVCIQVSDDLAAALGTDGSLYVTGQGRVASDVVQVDVSGSYVIAVRSDGSVYCTNPAVSIPGEWKKIAYAVLAGDGALAVTEDGVLLQSGCRYDLPDTNVLAVCQGSGQVGVMLLDQRFFSCQLNGKEPETQDHAGNFAAFTVVGDENVPLYDRDGGVHGMIYGNDEIYISMRKAIQNLPEPDLGPSGTE